MILVGVRRALASLVLLFYAAVFALLLAPNVPPEWSLVFRCIGGIYGVAFLGLAFGFFWARWFAIGVALSGVIQAAVGLWQMGPEEIILFLGGTHLAAVLLLWGNAMAARFDGQEAWRKRFHIDENAAHRLGRAIIRAGVSLPYVVMYGLAPKPGSHALLAIGAAALAFGGTYGLIKMRTWGVAALAGAAGLCAYAALQPAAFGFQGLDASAAAGVGAIALAGAVAPFAAPALRFLRGR